MLKKQMPKGICFLHVRLRLALRAIKKRPFRSEIPLKIEMTLDYCFFCHDKKHFCVVKGHFCSLLLSNIID